MNQQIADMGRRALAGERLGRPVLSAWVEGFDAAPHDALYWANAVRTDRFGRQVKLCSIAAGRTGGCGEDCKWCAQSRRVSPPAEPVRTTPECIADAADQASARRAASFGVVNSGRRPARRDLDEVATAAEIITGRCEETLQICASLGELTPDEARRLVEAGVTRYNHNLETSRRFFPSVVGSHCYDDRMATLRTAREAGMGLCCGGIFGLGESWDDRIDLALTLRDEVRPDVVPLNFLNPIPGTALADIPRLAPTEALGIVALFRVAMPDVDLKIAGGREVTLRDLQSWMFHAGVTSCLIGNYLTTLGRDAQQDLQMIDDLGLEVVREFNRP